MDIKKNILSLSLGAFLMFTPNAFATKLPNDVWNFVKGQLPNANQRFDSVLMLSDDVMYIPLYPPSTTTVDEIKVEYVYPAGKTLKDLPEVVLLNNGYSLLKVFKDNKGNYSLTQKDDLPIKVRLGLMPQDMLTPVGLKMPESLKLTLGDLLIPSKEENSLVLKDENNQSKVSNPFSPVVKRNEFIPTVDFKDKKTFINPRNSKFLEVYDSTSQTPLYELKLSAMPLKIISSETSKVALVLYWNKKNVEIIDLKDERVIETITLDANASDVILNKKDNIAYVASQNANAIYLINLNSMKLDRVIKLDQKPAKLAYSNFDNTIAFFDEYSSKVFHMINQEDNYSVSSIGNASNISKILIDENNIYAISRIQNQLLVFNKHQSKLMNTIDLDIKPTDALLYQGKIYILCSKEGYIDVYDIAENKIISREQIAQDGFYSNMTLIPNENNILITGINSKKYLVYNLETMKLARSQESYIDVANIIILDKAQRL